MLDRSKFLAQINQASPVLFFDANAHESALLTAWAQFQLQREQLLELIQKRNWSLALPVWLEDPTVVQTAGGDDFPYAVLGVDGSQIYPDRHYADLDYFLLNVGGLLLQYGPQAGSADFFSQPHLLSSSGLHGLPLDEQEFSNDLVDLTREEFEFQEAFDRSAAFVRDNAGQPFLCLLDGSFIFWHLQGKPAAIKEHFLNRYLLYLRQFHAARIPVAAYVSMPRSKELTNVLRLVLCQKMQEQGAWCGGLPACSCNALDGVVDLHLMQHLLKPGQRSAVFLSKSGIADEYLLSVRPCFFFLHVGDEIARVELPYWMAQEPELLEFAARVVSNQSVKGRGYPVVLAEAHEQAVIKGADRDFFYHTLGQVLGQQNKQLTTSQKSLRKRIMGV